MRCSVCDREFVSNAKGRKRRYCQDACKQAAMRQRQRNAGLIESITPVVQIGDSLQALQGMKSQTVDLFVIDPPYNVGIDEWDNLGTGTEYQQWLRPYLSECVRLLTPKGLLFCFGVPQHLYHVKILLDSLGLKFQNWIAWRKRQGGRNGHILMRRHEDILLYSRTSAPWFNADAVSEERHPGDMRTYKGKVYDRKNIGDVWEFNQVDSQSDERTTHPTQKPLALIERIIQIGCPAGGLVVDPFGGSGTTSVAAINLRRRSIYLEKEEKYARIALTRFAASLKQ